MENPNRFDAAEARRRLAVKIESRNSELEKASEREMDVIFQLIEAALNKESTRVVMDGKKITDSTKLKLEAMGYKVIVSKDDYGGTIISFLEDYNP